MFPRWLSWLFVLFIGYLLYTGYNPLRSADTVAVPRQKAGEPAQEYPSLTALMDGTRWRKALNPDYRPEDQPCGAPAPEQGRLDNYAIIDHPGRGSAAECGSTITLQLTQWNASGAPSKPPATLQLTLGNQPILDALLLDIRPGETRTLILTVPKTGYKTLPSLKKNTTQLLTITRIEPPKEEPKEEPATTTKRSQQAE